MTTHSFNSSNRPADGGIQRGGPRDAFTQYSSSIETLSVPRPISSLGSADNSRAQQRELSIQLREFATGLFLVGFVALVAVLLFVGYVGYRTLIA